MSEKAIAIVSGGLDSVTLAYHLASLEIDFELHLISFNYGQRHKKELVYAKRAALALGCQYDLIDLSVISPFLKGSSLTDRITVPEGHYAAANMAATVVPNRNAMMLSVAYAIAVAEGAQVVATGVHAGDHPIYPDCRPAFIEAFNTMEKLATEGYGHPRLHLYAPFVHMGKHDIVRLGSSLGVPYGDTWSCYQGGENHCGKCGTCVERIESFIKAGVPDPTLYEDKAFALAELAKGPHVHD
jgi:7-cyano-7-deazaguanine synthase